MHACTLPSDFVQRRTDNIPHCFVIQILYLHTIERLDACILYVRVHICVFVHVYVLYTNYSQFKALIQKLCLSLWLCVNASMHIYKATCRSLTAMHICTVELSLRHSCIHASMHSCLCMHPCAYTIFRKIGVHECCVRASIHVTIFHSRSSLAYMYAWLIVCARTYLCIYKAKPVSISQIINAQLYMSAFSV